MSAAQNRLLGSVPLLRLRTMTETRHIFEARVKPAGATGREWDVTIIGPSSPGSLVTIDGKTYIRSLNGRLYDTDAIAASAPQWQGVKVYDDHLTQEEFEARQGMRSPAREWLGTIVNPRWVAKAHALMGTFKVIEDRLSQKLKNAWDAGVLSTIGLSIDTFPSYGGPLLVEGESLPVINGFKKILSVDLVGEPAAGGGFSRLLASVLRENDMTPEELKAALEEYGVVRKDDLPDLVKQEFTALAEAEEEEVDVEGMSAEEVEEALDERARSKAAVELQKLEAKAKTARHETDLARTELMVERKLETAKLPEKFETAIRAQFSGRIVEAKEVDVAIKNLKEAHASLDPTGRVRAGGADDIQVGLDGDTRFELEFGRLMMGNSTFKALEHVTDETVTERMQEAKAHKAWINAGKPDLPRYDRVSSLLYDRFGGNPLLDPRAMEAATTSSLSTVVKNTVNIMLANDYSQREQWWAPIVRTEEVDTIDQSTLARVYGVNTLSTVSEGQVYTELTMADEEETASFVKRGNYIGITLETLMRDKINYIRRIPTILADAWYNTQSSLVSAVFTVNSATGPVLADTGTLFNATAASSTGGHANLLTTALSHSQYGVVRIAMMKQTDQPLGAGRRLLLEPRYILGPVDLETTALEIRNSEYVPGADFDSAGGGAQTRNMHAGRFDFIPVPDWTDTDNWAAVADPMRFPAIWLIYPRGQRTPQIFSAESETGGSMFTNDELRFKVRLMTYRFSATYDCAPVSDWRPLHKSNV